MDKELTGSLEDTKTQYFNSCRSQSGWRTIQWLSQPILLVVRFCIVSLDTWFFQWFNWLSSASIRVQLPFGFWTLFLSKIRWVLMILKTQYRPTERTQIPVLNPPSYNESFFQTIHFQVGFIENQISGIMCKLNKKKRVTRLKCWE